MQLNYKLALQIIATVRDSASGDSTELTKIKVLAVKRMDTSMILVHGLNNG